jgi:hypothetical protein
LVVTCICCAITVQLDWHIICRLCFLLLLVVLLLPLLLLLVFLVVVSLDSLGTMFAILTSWSIRPSLQKGGFTLRPPCSLLFILVLNLRIVPLCRDRVFVRAFVEVSRSNR